MEKYKFTQNKKCEFFPCHKVKNEEDFNCLFCFCPLYALGKNCGGNYIYTKDNIKDCSNCTFPHHKDNYNKVLEKTVELINKVKSEKSEEDEHSN